MTGRPRKPWKGKPVTNAPPGFPLYAASRAPRVLTSDPWAYMKHVATDRLPKAREVEALAFVDQALEFFQAADNPQIGSRPLLYYYSFLNLAKLALLIRGFDLPPAPKHGISDPRANIRTRLRLSGQTIRWEKGAHDHSQIFPEFVVMLGGSVKRAGGHKVIHLLAQIPGIHRTYCQARRKARTSCP
ncbi:MAG: YaaC family protein [Chloroflexi bacterium]|nr:YaaC family protein [Chloroflexota bacterium]